MSVVLIKEQIKVLVELQVIDTQIYNLKKRLASIPLELDAKARELESKKASLNIIEENIKNVLVKKKDRELELSAKEGAMNKFQSQLSLIKTNKEYTAMLSEIGGAKADKSLLEDEILKIMMELDVLKAETEKEKNNLSNEEKKTNEQKAKLLEEQKIITQDIEALTGKRNQIAPKINHKILNTYEKILKNKDGLALVKVTDNTCQGCFMNTSHQVVNEIRMYEHIVICGSCARILYEEWV